MTSILAPEPICIAVYAIVVMFLAAIGINAAVVVQIGATTG